MDEVKEKSYCIAQQKKKIALFSIELCAMINHIPSRRIKSRGEDTNLSGGQVDDLKGVLDDAGGEELLTVVASSHHH